jgi:hypothetical protein
VVAFKAWLKAILFDDGIVGLRTEESEEDLVERQGENFRAALNAG